MKTAILVVAAILAFSSRAFAQVTTGVGVGPDAFGLGEGKYKKESTPAILPLALATSLAFDATTWLQVQTSTSPAHDLTAMLQKGYYKIELFQMILLAKRSGTALSALQTEREKGASLREMAKKRNLDYDVLYEDSLDLDRKVEQRWLPAIMTVSVSTTPARGKK